MREILCRNPFNSGKTQTGYAVGNPERILETGTCNGQSFDVGSSESKRGRPLVGFDMI
jgi:hypothetical protein